MIRKPKHNFKLRDFERVIIAFWATDDPFFMTGRCHVQFHFITFQFLCTDARVSSFTPASVGKVGRGLCYKIRAMMCIDFIIQVLILVRILTLYYFVPSMLLGVLDGGLTSGLSKTTKTLRILGLQNPRGNPRITRPNPAIGLGWDT